MATNENEKELKAITMSKKEFWWRFAIWTLFSFIVPIVFIAIKYQIFAPKEKMNIGGWGMIIILITAIFSFALLSYIKQVLSNASLLKQCLNGFTKIVLPLGSMLLILFLIRNSIDQFINTFAIILLLETIAIPFNPFPKWVYINKTEENENIIDLLLNKREKARNNNNNNNSSSRKN